MSAFGPKQTLLIAPHMSAFGNKADKPFCSASVGGRGERAGVTDSEIKIGQMLQL
jgi:hypothetical protein